MNAPTYSSALEALKFDNRFVEELPGDPETRNFSRQVQGAVYSKVQPTPVRQPQLLAYAQEVADLLDMSKDTCQSELFTQIFAGNKVLPGMTPYANCYGGHQFGVWAGQLGDGRAINLGDVINKQGERWALQLKGAGLTPYSRSADGLAVLRSSVREFLCSEAMFHLGVPTTRALSLVLTGETVIRDMFYNGNPKAEPGAVVCRVAPSFIRFGNFQIHAARSEVDILKKLADYTINTHFSHLGKPSKDTYLAWFEEVCRTTVAMILHWQRVGFVHGVMNTDNMSILGLTIDYGPYGWLENYDPDWTPNTTDRAERRYRYSNQPACAFWNLAQLANAIYPLIGKSEPLQHIMEELSQAFNDQWLVMMNHKLGLFQIDPDQDEALQSMLLNILVEIETDMTIFYRQLAKVDLEQASHEPLDVLAWIRPLDEAYYDPEQKTAAYLLKLVDWLKKYSQRVEQEGITQAVRQTRMDQVNPKYVLRNYLAQLAIDKAEQGDFNMVAELLELLRKPYEEQPEKQQFAAKRPDWARQRPGCSMLSCSS